MTEPDVLAVRELATEPTAESVSRTWYQITKRTAVERRPARARWLLPAVVASVAALVMAGSLVVLRMGEGRLWPAASTPDAIAALRQLADAAERGTAVRIAPGQLVRTDSVGWAAGFVADVSGGPPNVGELAPQDRQMWYDPATGKVVKLMAGEQDLLSGQKGETIPQQRPPDIAAPTLAWLASLPTDPATLLRALRVAVGENDSWSVDHQLWDALAQVYTYCEIALTPAQRAALLRAAARMTAMSTRAVTVAGQALLAIRNTDRDDGVEILFDPVTGRAVGRATAMLHPDITIVAPPEAPDLPRDIGYQATWTQTVVDPL